MRRQGAAIRSGTPSVHRQTLPDQRSMTGRACRTSLAAPSRSLCRSLWVSALLFAACIAWSQEQSPPPKPASAPLMLIVSQPSALDRKADFVDIGFFLARSVKETGLYDVALYNASEPHVAAAVKDGRLTQQDAAAYLTEAAARKVAEAIGAVYIVRVSAARGRDGIGAVADMQVRMGSSQWSTVFSSTLVPYKGRDRKSQLLEAIHAHVGALMPRITAAPAVAPANVARSTETAKPDSPTGARAEDKGPARTSPEPSGQTAPSAAEMLVDRFRRSGDTANLILTLRRAITDRPRDPKLRRDLVAALRLRGWTEAAREEAERALLLCPGDAGLHRLLGDGHRELGELDRAISAYQEAIRLEPGNAANHVALGDALWDQGKASEAEAAYRAGQEADPKSALPRLRMAKLRVQALRYQDAIAEMTAARELMGDAGEAAYAAAYAEMAGVLEGVARDVIGRLVAIRRDQIAGTRSREESHKAAVECRTAASGVSACFSDMPLPSRFGPVQAAYVQAAALLAQAASAYLSHLETQSEADDKEATLLRQEAARQLDEAAKKLASLTSPAQSTR